MTRTSQHREPRRPRQEAPEALWDPHALCGFPADQLAALGHTPTEATYAAWVLARHGHSADWLERHFQLGSDVAGLLVLASKSKGCPGPASASPPTASNNVVAGD